MKYIFTVCILLSLLSTNVYATDDNSCNIKVGVVPQFDQRRLLEIWDPILKQLEGKTSCSYELIGSKSIAEFEDKFLEGIYDIAYMNPYHLVMANNAQGYIPIARSGEKKLQGILVVRKDSSIQYVKELDAKEIAFPSPNALGASLLMRAELATKYGLNITPRYVKTDGSVYLHVIKKFSQAGGGVGRTLKGQDDNIKDKLRILYKTAKVNAHPLAIHPRITQETRQQIQVAFLQLAKDKPELVDNIPMKKPIKSSLEDYKDLKEMGLEKFKG